MESNGNSNYLQSWQYFVLDVHGFPKLTETEWFAEVQQDPDYGDTQVEPDDWLEWASTFG